MRKLVFTTGAISILLMSIGAVIKLFHINGWSLIILIASIIFDLIFVPAAIIYNFRIAKIEKI